MPIYKGNNKIGEVYKGSAELAEVFRGNTKVFAKAMSAPAVFRFKISDSPFDEDYGTSYVPATGTNSTNGVWSHVSGNIWDCTIPAGVSTDGEFQNKLTITGYSGAYFYLKEIINPETVSANYLFAGCTGLIEVPALSLPSAHSLLDMFAGCTNLKQVGAISNGTLDGLNDAARMFFDCHELVEAPMVNLTGARHVQAMFHDCYNLERIPQYDLSTVQYLSGMFQGCQALGHYYSLPALDFSSALDCSYMFKDCGIYLTMQTPSYTFNTANCENFKGMFDGAAFKYAWTIDTSKAFYCTEMFKHCAFNGNSSTPISLNLGRAVWLDSMFENGSFDSVPIAYNGQTIADHCSSMFKNCYWCDGASLYAWYIKLSGQQTPPYYHNDVFTNCCTQTGNPADLAYMAQIPGSWGGTGT